VHRLCRRHARTRRRRLDPDAKFSRIGLDSAMSVQLAVALEERLGIEMAPT
jgi:acyl carrier protein